MPKFASNGMLDAPFVYVRDRAARQILCSDFPSTYIEAATTFALADTNVDASHFTLADDVNGRKVIISEQNGVPIDATGEGDHMAWVRDTDSLLLMVTELSTPKNVASGSLTQFESLELHMPDPT